MRKMKEFVRAAVRDPNQRIRERALALVPSAYQWIGQIRALQQWVQQNIRYINDPTKLELVQTPQKTLEYAAGDCDDQSTLMCAMLDAIGHPCRLMAIGFRGGPLSHVLMQTKAGDKWITAETIAPRPLGWFPAGVTSRYILDV